MMLALTTQQWTLILLAICMGQRVKITITKTRKRKVGGNSGYVQCNVCHGTGRVKKKS